MREPWTFEDPACAGIGSEVFFPEKLDGNADSVYEPALAKICQGCSHLRECGDWALQNEFYGWWGGMSETERRRRRKKLGMVGWKGA